MRDNIYYEELLPPFQEEITPDTFKRRNKAITWQFVQICSSIAGFGSFALTKVLSYFTIVFSCGFTSL